MHGYYLPRASTRYAIGGASNYFRKMKSKKRFSDKRGVEKAGPFMILSLHTQDSPVTMIAKG